MRKTLFILAAMLFTMAMNAQLLSNSNITLQHAPYALKSFTNHKSFNSRLMTPARADLADNQRIMGHYDTDDVAASDDGLGITGLPGVIPISTILTPNEIAMFQGGKIVKFRVGLANSTTVSRVFVAPVSSSGSIGTLTEWTCSVSSAGWNEITLATPYEINLDDNMSLLIGFDYRQTSSNYPISAVAVGDIYPSYIYYQGSWQNVGLDSYGNLSVQCIVEKDNYPDYYVGVSELYVPTYTKLGEDIYYLFATRNLGVLNSIPAEACTYDILIDGEVVATISNPEELTNNNKDLNGYIPSDGLTPGRHTMTIRVNTLFGEPVENPVSTSKDFMLFENGFERQMHLIEQFTSTYCTYCPLGNSMLSILTSMRDDIAWVGIHGNMQSGNDPMSTAQGDTIMAYQGGDSYPSGSFDRSTGWEDDVNIVTGLGYYEQYHQQVAQAISEFFDYLAEAPSFATININSTYDAGTRQAVITIDGEITPDFDEMMGADSKLTVYITEDGITARQLNQGTWVSNYVHNGVFRVALNSAMGNNLSRNGNTYKNEFTYTIPSSWNAENLNVVAFISRPLANGATGVYTDMYVNQANKRKLGEFDEVPAGLRGDVNNDQAVTIADVTALIDYLLNHDASAINLDNANCNLDEGISIADVTALIDYLLSGGWPE
ncbi:MAG: Omp28-related outer membrane protein [Muribaculaceae bacterium]|nr:Omp28-related outer membrane protein [Muribaculaceae bacterium]